MLGCLLQTTFGTRASDGLFWPSRCSLVLVNPLHCPTLPYTTLHSPTLPYTVLHCPTPPYTALHCPTLPYTAVHCPALANRSQLTVTALHGYTEVARILVSLAIDGQELGGSVNARAKITELLHPVSTVQNTCRKEISLCIA